MLLSGVHCSRLSNWSHIREGLQVGRRMLLSGVHYSRLSNRSHIREGLQVGRRMLLSGVHYSRLSNRSHIRGWKRQLLSIPDKCSMEGLSTEQYIFCKAV